MTYPDCIIIILCLVLYIEVSVVPKICLANLAKGQKFVYPNEIFFSHFLDQLNYPV